MGFGGYNIEGGKTAYKGDIYRVGEVCMIMSIPTSTAKRYFM